MKINREELLNRLRLVQAGLSKRGSVEQSDCFLFKDGEVITFNDEVSARIKSELPREYKGAVLADPLIQFLDKTPNDELSIQFGDKEIQISAPRMDWSIPLQEGGMASEFEVVEAPGVWHRLPEDFGDALGMAAECVSKTEHKFYLQCVHVHPKWVEASDDIQVLRYRLKVPIQDRFLMRGTSIKRITNLGIIKISESNSWVHFRGPNRLVVSCRRWSDEYPSVSIKEILKTEGHAISFPKRLSECIERAGIVSSYNADDDHITVKLRSNKIILVGASDLAGRDREYMQVEGYKGPNMDFLISPVLFSKICEQHNQCEVTQDYLKIASGAFTYLTCLKRMDESEAKGTQEAE